MNDYTPYFVVLIGYAILFAWIGRAAKNAPLYDENEMPVKHSTDFPSEMK